MSSPIIYTPKAIDIKKCGQRDKDITVGHITVSGIKILNSIDAQGNTLVHWYLHLSSFWSISVCNQQTIQETWLCVGENWTRILCCNWHSQIGFWSRDRVTVRRPTDNKPPSVFSKLTWTSDWSPRSSLYRPSLFATSFSLPSSCLPARMSLTWSWSMGTTAIYMTTMAVGAFSGQERFFAC